MALRLSALLGVERVIVQVAFEGTDHGGAVMEDEVVEDIRERAARGLDV